MPTYDYQCEKCQNEFTLILSISEHEKDKVRCPKCKSRKVRQLMSAFMAKTTRKS
jgi:putative FmdB family regulatory protein